MAMTPEQKQVWDLRKKGHSLNEIAIALNVTKGTVEKRLTRARKWIDASEGQVAAMEVTGLQPDTAKFGWRIIQHQDGSRDSVFWDARGQADEDKLESIRSIMDGIQPVKPVKPPKHSDEDLLTVYPIADAHIGMRAWGKEAGADYDAEIACARLQDWIGRCVASSPASKEAVIVDVGDLFHANDDTNATPKSKHVLDVDTRFYRTAEVTLTALSAAIDCALHKHEFVRLVILPGNHDPYAYLIILFAMAERYRNDPRVEVIKQPGEFWIHQFGQNMLAFHHGDKAKAERLVLFLADEFPDIWGATKYRHLWTGHLHHHKSADIGGVTWEQLRAMTEKDAYARSHAYSARSQLQGITLHREKGEISRVKVGA